MVARTVKHAQHRGDWRFPMWFYHRPGWRLSRCIVVNSQSSLYAGANVSPRRNVRRARCAVTTPLLRRGHIYRTSIPTKRYASGFHPHNRPAHKLACNGQSAEAHRRTCRSCMGSVVRLHACNGLLIETSPSTGRTHSSLDQPVGPFGKTSFKRLRDAAHHRCILRPCQT